MRKVLFLFVSLFALSCLQTVRAASESVREASALAARLLPGNDRNFVFEDIKADQGRDVYELESRDGKVIIRGNSANSMAVGLNHYLKYYANVSVSWYLDDPVEAPAVWPALEKKERVTARTDKRFFLNYCTFGYSMPWWQWEDWERLIDWMALNGVNMPLAITGQEKIWYEVWKDLGLTDEEIRNYFTGPAHLPWHRMTNFDRWHSPLPHSWLNHQAELQKKIVNRERALNMTPVLPAFAGHVPPEIKRVYKDAHITQMSSWGGFEDKYRSYFLDPLDPLFAKIQKAFLEKQTSLYGTDHIYGADPFNEIDSPSWEPEYLARVSRTIYDSMKQCDPEAVWLQMTWLFYFDRNHWTNPRIDAFVNGVPRDKMILLDYFAENTEVWKRTESYFGQPYLWCYLGNFGGNTMLAGNLKEVGKRIENAFAQGGKNFAGLGSTLEGLDINPLMYEYVFEKAWEGKMTDEEWVARWADRRAGKENPQVRQAWKELLDKVYVATAQLGQATLTNARPSLEGHGNWTTNPGIAYDNRDLFRIWETMLKAGDMNRDSYRFDVVNIGRQVLGNHFKIVRDRFAEAYGSKDKQALKKSGQMMRDILLDMERLLECHETFSLKRWLDEASLLGKDDDEAAYYRKNARCLLTTWGDKGQSLNDYASRSWSGLMDTYYRPRWEKFIQGVTLSLEEGKGFDQKEFNRQAVEMEQSWVDSEYKPAPARGEDGVRVARELMKKYRDAILEVPAK